MCGGWGRMQRGSILLPFLLLFCKSKLSLYLYLSLSVWSMHHIFSMVSVSPEAESWTQTNWHASVQPLALSKSIWEWHTDVIIPHAGDLTQHFTHCVNEWTSWIRKSASLEIISMMDAVIFSIHWFWLSCTFYTWTDPCCTVHGNVVTGNTQKDFQSLQQFINVLWPLCLLSSFSPKPWTFQVIFGVNASNVYVESFHYSIVHRVRS